MEWSSTTIGAMFFLMFFAGFFLGGVAGFIGGVWTAVPETDMPEPEYGEQET